MSYFSTVESNRSARGHRDPEGRLGGALIRGLPAAVLRRSGRGGRVLAQQLDLARELSPSAAWQFRADKISARRWAPAARRSFYAEMWAEAASLVEARHQDIGNGFTLFHRGGRRTITWFHEVQLDDPVTLKLALDRSLVHRLLAANGVPVPAHQAYGLTNLDAGLALLHESDDPLVVKPASGTGGGFGVTCAVDSVADFRRATLHASRHSERLITERSVQGQEYRLLFLDGELLDVIRRRPPHVVGDGRSSVAELISAENKRREGGGGRRGISFLDVDLDCVLTLDRAGLSLRSVPDEGTETPVKSAANANAPKENQTVDRNTVGDAVVDEARRAVLALRLRLAGVDLITPDLTSSLTRSGGAVIEVNGTPGLHHHYLVADADRATKAAALILERLLEAEGDRGPTAAELPALS